MKKPLRKVMAAALALTLIMSLLAGCGSKDEGTSGDVVTIKFGIHVANPEEQENVTYQIVQAFNEKYEGQYAVEFEASDTETHSKNMKLEAEDGTLPDIFWIDASEAPDYAANGYLLDGFPRNLEQAEGYDKILSKLGKDLGIVINLTIPNELLKQRIIGRRMCKDCGAIYNIYSDTMKPQKEGICDKCNGQLYQRADDNEETVTSRLDVYNKQTRPLVDYYDKLGKLVSIDSNGTIEDTVKDIIKTLEA